jgi:hypothetical protein
MRLGHARTCSRLRSFNPADAIARDVLGSAVGATS